MNFETQFSDRMIAVGWASPSPSPRPSPQWRGRNTPSILAKLWLGLAPRPANFPMAPNGCFLSRQERVRVRIRSNGISHFEPRKRKGLPQSRQRHGLRREAQRHAAFARTQVFLCPTRCARPKAVSPLRSATTVHDGFGLALLSAATSTALNCGGSLRSRCSAFRFIGRGKRTNTLTTIFKL